jgi:hypothetical protein
LRDEVPQPYKTADKIIVRYILMFMFLSSKWEDVMYRMLAGIP